MRLFKYAKDIDPEELTEEQLRDKMNGMMEYINEGRKDEGLPRLRFEWPETRAGLVKLFLELQEMM